MGAGSRGATDPLERVLSWIGGAVVCVVIVLALSLFLPSLEPLLSTSPPRQVVAACHSLRNSIVNYHAEYQVWPIPSSVEPSGVVTLESDPRLMEILLAIDEKLNPRQLAFGEWRSARETGRNGILHQANDEIGSLVDPWGNEFRITIDTTREWNPDMLRENAPVIVFSAGPDGDFQTEEDNLSTAR